MQNIKINYQHLLTGIAFAYIAYLSLTGWLSQNMGVGYDNEFFISILMGTPALLFIFGSFQIKKSK
jgi:hypothetical protein